MEYSDDIIEAFTKIALSKKRKRAAATAAQTANLNAIERAENKLTSVIDRASGLPIYVSAREAVDTSKYIAKLPELGNIVKQGLGGTESVNKDLVWNLINQNPEGWQSGLTSMNPQNTLKTVQDNETERYATQGDILDNIINGTEVRQGPTSNIIAPEVITGPDDKKMLLNKFTNQSDSIQLSQEEIALRAKSQEIDPKTVIDNYNKSHTSLKEPKNITNSRGEVVLGSWDSTKGKYVDLNNGEVLDEVKPYIASKKASAPQWHSLSDKDGKTIKARYDVDKKEYFHPVSNKKINTDGFQLISNKLSKTQIVDSIFGDTKTGAKSRWNSLDNDFSSAINISDPANRGDMFLTAPYKKEGAWVDAATSLTGIGTYLYTSEILTLKEIQDMVGKSPDDKTLKKVLMATTGKTADQYDWWKRYKDIMGSPEEETIKKSESWNYGDAE